jgi:hypothetical protein
VDEPEPVSRRRHRTRRARPDTSGAAAPGALGAAGPPSTGPPSAVPSAADPPTAGPQVADPDPVGADRTARGGWTAPGDDPLRPAGSAPPAGESGRRSPRRPDPGDRALRGLVTTRSTAVSSQEAMRAREVARPSEDDLAEAARTLSIVRRHYVPPTDLPGSRRRRQPGSPGGAGSAS